jgi:hypothetical protein
MTFGVIKDKVQRSREGKRGHKEGDAYGGDRENWRRVSYRPSVEDKTNSRAKC